MDAGREGLRILAGVQSDDQVLPAPLDGEPFLLEPVREGACIVVRWQRHADLPGRKAALDRFLLPGLGRRLVVPAVLFVEPVLDRARHRGDVVVAELGLDDRTRLLRLLAGRRIDEDVVVVLGDDEAAGLEVACELGGLAGQAPEMEAVEKAAGALLLDVDPDAEVVAYTGILPKSAICRCSRCFVMPPRKNG